MDHRNEERGPYPPLSGHGKPPLESTALPPEDTPLNHGGGGTGPAGPAGRHHGGGQNFATVNVYLPPVTYDAGVTVACRSDQTSTDTETRREPHHLTGPVRIAPTDTGISWNLYIDFVGSGNGVGFSASARAFLPALRFSGWRTGAGTGRLGQRPLIVPSRTTRSAVYQ